MKLIPTQSERTALLLGILALMAVLFPQSWSTMRWQANVNLCLLQMYLYASIVMLACVVAGAKRQPIVALLSMSSLAIAYWFAPSGNLVSHGYRTNLIGPDATGWEHATEAIIWLAVACSIAFATSFAISFLLDRFAGPLWGSKLSKQHPDASEPGSASRKSNRIRFLIVLAVGLFLFQAVGNVTGASLGRNFAETYLLPIGFLLLASFCCGLICRLRIVAAWTVGAFLAVASMGAVVTVAVAARKGNDIDSWFMFFAFLICSAVIALVFALIGNTRPTLTRALSWLSIAIVGIAVGLGVIGMKHDLHSLLLGDKQFDFPRAAFIKSLNSDPSVRVAHQIARWTGWRDELFFSFGSESSNDFFDHFDASGLSNGGCQVSIDGLTETVDLSAIKKCQPLHLNLANCKLSSQQLADLFELGVSVQLIDCEFIRGKTAGTPNLIGAGVYHMATKPGTTKQFMEAIEDFEIENVINLWGDHAADGDIEAMLDKLPSFKSKLGRISWNGSPISESQILGRAGLEHLSANGCDFQLADGDKPIYPGSFALVLKSKATVGGHVDNSNVYWGLVLGAVGEFNPYQLEFHQTEITRLDTANQKKLLRSHFGYEQAEESGEIKNLWLPRCDTNIIAPLANLNSLTSLSFDVEWLCNPSVSESFSSTLPSIKDISNLNQLVNLRELYFSSYDQVDLSALKSLAEMKTIQFTSSSTGFNRDLFPKLKEVRILLDKPLKNGLMKELAATETLQTLIVVNFDATNFDRAQFLAQASRRFGNKVDIRVVHIDDGETLVPEHFKRHRLEVRKKCIEKYLD
jgi:hypothetical protein